MELQRFKLIVIPLREKLQNLAKSMLANNVDAEDAVQETFLKLWNIRSQLDNHPNVPGYAMTTIKNICIDKIRSERRNVSLDEINMMEQSKNPYHQTEQNDDISLIKRIINTLPELQRCIMLMRDVEGYELDEIAEITGSEAGTIRVNLSRARKKVKDKFISINAIRLQQ